MGARVTSQQIAARIVDDVLAARGELDLLAERDPWRAQRLRDQIQYRIRMRMSIGVQMPAEFLVFNSTA